MSTCLQHVLDARAGACFRVSAVKVQRYCDERYLPTAGPASPNGQPTTQSIAGSQNLRNGGTQRLARRQPRLQHAVIH